MSLQHYHLGHTQVIYRTESKTELTRNIFLKKIVDVGHNVAFDDLKIYVHFAFKCINHKKLGKNRILKQLCHVFQTYL